MDLHIYMAWVGHSTPDTIPEMTSDTQRPSAPIRWARKNKKNNKNIKKKKDEQGSGGEMEEKEKQKDVGTMKRGRTGDSRVVRNKLMWISGDAS
jgi:hypothetical protein